jgi:monolysocardiolipin acyltransferase
MHGLNSTEVYGADKMQPAVFQRQPGQPLITVSNHTAAVDDPFVISSVLPPHKLLNANNLRWTLCATEKCFSSKATSAFFRSVKVLPLTKGHGVFQEVGNTVARCIPVVYKRKFTFNTFTNIAICSSYTAIRLFFVN